MKKEINQYYSLCLWFALNMDSKDYSADQFDAVLEKIGIYEGKLKELGVSEIRIQNLITQVARAYKTSLIT